MKKHQTEPPEFTFKTDEYVYGIFMELIDNNPYNKITVDIWFEHLYLGSYDIPHKFDIDDDHLGRSTAFFKTQFRPFKTTKTIKIMVKTKLLYNDLITMKLLTSKVND